MTTKLETRMLTAEQRAHLTIIVATEPDSQGRQQFTMRWWDIFSWDEKGRPLPDGALHVGLRGQVFFSQLGPYVARARAAGKAIVFEGVAPAVSS